MANSNSVTKNAAIVTTEEEEASLSLSHTHTQTNTQTMYTVCIYLFVTYGFQSYFGAFSHMSIYEYGTNGKYGLNYDYQAF